MTLFLDSEGTKKYSNNFTAFFFTFTLFNSPFVLFSPSRLTIFMEQYHHHMDLQFTLLLFCLNSNTSLLRHKLGSVCVSVCMTYITSYGWKRVIRCNSNRFKVLNQWQSTIIVTLQQKPLELSFLAHTDWDGEQSLHCQMPRVEKKWFNQTICV